MKHRAQTWLSVALVAAGVAGCGSDPATPGDDQPSTEADAGSSDGPPTTPTDAPPVDPPALCGDQQPDIAGITRTEGLAIGADGTLYYSQSKAIGRLQPGRARDDDWARLAGTGSQVWGLAVTASHLYVGYPSDRALWRIDLATGAAARWVADAGQPNGVIIGADGALYYSDFAGGEVYRVDLATGEPTQVTARAPSDELEQPNGLYSLDAEHLLVLAYGAGEVWELTLRDGVETGRALRATVSGALDGITRDRDGRWYLTDNRGGRVVRRPADFAAPGGAEDVVDLDGAIPSAANLLFGRGALACDDLYVTTSAAMQRVTID